MVAFQNFFFPLLLTAVFNAETHACFFPSGFHPGGGGENGGSNGSGKDSKDGGRRLQVNQEVFLWDQRTLACENRNYQVYIHTDTHVSVVAHPVDYMGSQEDCPTLIFHSTVGGENLKVAEELNMDPQYSNWRYITDSHPLLQASLRNIADSFDAVDYNREVEYDVVLNNCATLVLQLLFRLGYQVTDDFNSYVAGSLHANNHTIHVLRDSPFANVIFGQALQQDDYTLLHTLTTHYVKEQHQVFLEESGASA